MNALRISYAFLSLGLVALFAAVTDWVRTVPDEPLIDGVQAMPDLHPVLVQATDRIQHKWHPPESQSAGIQWVFEVFTPPLIYFNPHEQLFVLTPPITPGPSPLPELPFEWVSSQQYPYRLQFAGYIGDQGRYRIEIHDLESNLFVRGTVGEVFTEADFRILAFRADRIRQAVSAVNGDTPYVEEIITLTIEDLRENRTVQLGRDLALDERYGVVLRLVDGEFRLVHEGDVIRHDGLIWVCSRIDVLGGELIFEQHNPEDGQTMEVIRHHLHWSADASTKP